MLNLGKNSENLWPLSQNPFSPGPPPQLHATEANLQMSITKMLGLPSSTQALLIR